MRFSMTTASADRRRRRRTRGLDTDAPCCHPRRRPLGVLHGSRSYVLQDDDGQIAESHSISAGLDYPGVGPQHSLLKDRPRRIRQA